jgi:hypothetical protein
MGALFYRDEGEASQRCTLEQHPAREQVWTFSPTEFVISSPTVGHYAVQCKEESGKRNHQIRLAGLNKVILSTGCTLTTGAHEIDTNQDIRAYARPLQEAWTWDPTQMAEGNLPTAIQHLITQVKNGKIIQQKIDEASVKMKQEVEELHKRWKTSQQTVMWETHPTVWGTNLATLVLTIVSCVSTFMVCRRTNNRQQHTELHQFVSPPGQNILLERA